MVGDLLLVRISAAENNVKGQLWFSAAMGQIEAMEAGTSPCQGAVEGARKSAEICLDLLAIKVAIWTSESENALQDEMGFDMQGWSMDSVMPDA